MLAAGCSQPASQAVEANSAVTSSKDTKKQTGTPVQPPALVRVVTIKQETIAPEFRALGNVRPRHESIVASGSDGVVAKFHVEVGDFVSEGGLV